MFKASGRIDLKHGPCKKGDDDMKMVDELPKPEPEREGESKVMKAIRKAMISKIIKGETGKVRGPKRISRQTLLSRRDELVWIIACVLSGHSKDVNKYYRRKAKMLLILLEEIGVMFIPTDVNEDIMAMVIMASIKKTMRERGLLREPTLEDAKVLLREIMENSPFNKQEDLGDYAETAITDMEAEWAAYIEGRGGDPYEDEGGVK